MAHGLHGRLDGSEAGDHDDRKLRVDLLDPLQEAQAIHPRHDQIAQDQIQGRLPDPLEGLLAILGCPHLIPVGDQAPPDEGEEVPFIIHH